jgi:hypothetical protein
MKDLQLDFTNKLITNKLISGKERILQQIKLAIHTWTGDWLLDQNFGVDYDNAFSSEDLMEVYVRQQISQVEGVSNINSFTIDKVLDSNNAFKFVINAEISFDNDVLTITEEV